MQIFINDMPTDISDTETLRDTLQRLQYPEQGVALAVNQTIIPKEKWSSTFLKASDHITIFQIITGG